VATTSALPSASRGESAAEGLDDEAGGGAAGVLLLAGHQEAVAHRELAETLVDDEVGPGDGARFFLDPEGLDAAATRRWILGLPR
jgi:hypothetical protein